MTWRFSLSLSKSCLCLFYFLLTSPSVPTSAPCQKGVYKTNFKTFPNAKKFYTELSSATLQINYAEMLYATTSTFTLAREWKVRVEGGTCVNNTGETTCRGGLVVLCANLHLFFFLLPNRPTLFLPGKVNGQPFRTTWSTGWYINYLKYSQKVPAHTVDLPLPTSDSSPLLHVEVERREEGRLRQ
jgi:hypothetical protein